MYASIAQQAGNATSTFVLAHLSDPHLTSLDGVHWRQLVNKRILGYLSWRRRRRFEHRSEILATLVRDLRGAAPDHTVVTGDLTHLGTPQECREALTWIEALGTPERVTVIPGNHDTYVREHWERSVGLWNRYMSGDRPPHAGTRLFPFLRCRGPLALIALSTARPSAPLLATGKLGRNQLAALEAALQNAGEAGLFRVVLLHHPPLPGAIHWRKRLVDASALHGILKRHGAELILHGHAHCGLSDRRMPIFGVPSASASGRHSAESAGYNLYHITRSTDGWQISVTHRGFSNADGRIRTLKTRQLTTASGAA